MFMLLYIDINMFMRVFSPDPINDVFRLFNMYLYIYTHNCVYIFIYVLRFVYVYKYMNIHMYMLLYTDINMFMRVFSPDPINDVFRLFYNQISGDYFLYRSVQIF